MSILSGIRDFLSAIAGKVVQRVDEVREHFEERRAKSLAEKLDELAASSQYKDWRHSIRDLAYLAGQDGSAKGRAALWDELGMEGRYERTAAQNMRLHAALLEWLPDHGIPWPNED